MKSVKIVYHKKMYLADLVFLKPTKLCDQCFGI